MKETKRRRFPGLPLNECVPLSRHELEMEARDAARHPRRVVSARYVGDKVWWRQDMFVKCIRYTCSK